MSADCEHFVNPRDYVPVCPTHRLALIHAPKGHGMCPWRGPVVEVSRTERYASRCHTWGPQSWVWSHRDKFMQDDLPPFSGELPPEYDRTGGPTYDRALDTCRACDTRTVHVFGENRRICTDCGTCNWVLSELSRDLT